MDSVSPGQGKRWLRNFKRFVGELILNDGGMEEAEGGGEERRRETIEVLEGPKE